jgi:hypothetical protein
MSDNATKSALNAPCKRPKCQSGNAVADHVVVFGERNEMRLPVCYLCATKALLEGFEAYATSLDEDWSKINAESQ